MATQWPSSVDVVSEASPTGLLRPRSAGRPRSASRFQSTLSNLAEGAEHLLGNEDEIGDAGGRELPLAKQGTLTDGILTQEDDFLPECVEEDPLKATASVPLIIPALAEQPVNVTSKPPDESATDHVPSHLKTDYKLGPSLHRWFQRYESFFALSVCVCNLCVNCLRTSVFIRLCLCMPTVILLHKQV